MQQSDTLIPTAAAVIIDNNKVLLVSHGEKAGHITGKVGLPSGHVEAGETERQTVIREIKEETGLDVQMEDLSEFAGNYFKARILMKDGKEKLYGWRVFTVKGFTGELRGNNETTPQWVDINRLEELDKNGMLLPNVKTAIENSLK